ncbi:MAG: PQQ-binding-like beta-propeller repeat protein [Verrucomicrobia bacterium]|nr:PQQ-binding-like beta-propeller repeat protein [Verrucomicrobiota bacterium]
MTTLLRSRHLPATLGLLLFLTTPSRTRADDWPQWLGPHRDGVWCETGILESFTASGPPVRWRVPIGGGFAGPAVAKGRVFVTDRQLSPGTANPANPFDRGKIPGRERVLCLRERDGKVLWTYAYDCPYDLSYPSGPRTTPVVSHGRVYTLGATGRLLGLDAKTGARLWSRDFKQDFGVETPMWGFAANPLVDGHTLFCLVGGPGSTVVAFDTETGRERWRALTAKEPGYCPPMIYTFAGKRELIIWDPESVNALDPDTGKVYWTYPLTPVRAGMTIPTPRQSGDFLFLTSFYNGSLMLRVDSDQPALVWQSKKISEMNTDGLHSVFSTPAMEDGFLYGTCSYGQLRCLKADTGERLWETMAATTHDGKPIRWGNAFIVRNGDRYFLFNEKGDLILARLTPQGYHEISRAHLLDPTNPDPGRPVVWSHPAFANRCVFARNDREILRASLAAGR